MSHDLDVAAFQEFSNAIEQHVPQELRHNPESIRVWKQTAWENFRWQNPSAFAQIMQVVTKRANMNSTVPVFTSSSSSSSVKPKRASVPVTPSVVRDANDNNDNNDDDARIAQWLKMRESVNVSASTPSTTTKSSARTAASGAAAVSTAVPSSPVADEITIPTKKLKKPIADTAVAVATPSVSQTVSQPLRVKTTGPSKQVVAKSAVVVGDMTSLPSSARSHNTPGNPVPISLGDYLVTIAKESDQWSVDPVSTSNFVILRRHGH